LSLLQRWRFSGWTWLAWPVVLGFVVATLLAMAVEFRTQDQQRRDAALALVPLVYQGAAPHLVDNDVDALGRLVRLVLRVHPQIRELEIRGPLGEQLAYGRNVGGREPDWLSRTLSLLEAPALDAWRTLEPVPKPVEQLAAPAPPTLHIVLRSTSSDPTVGKRMRRYLRWAGGGLTLGLVLALVGIARIARGQQGLLTIARNLGQGRLESRAGVAAIGLTGELADAINHIGRQLLEAQDRYRGWMEQETGRLRRELTDERAKLRTLERSAEETETSSRVKGELYAQISHELRTPLAAIIGYSDLLRRASLPPAVSDQVETLSKSAHGLLAMVNDLLDWSRIEAGRLQLNESAIDLEDCVEDVIAMLAPLAYDKGLELVHIIYHDVPRQLVGDGQRLRQLLTNLVSNAIKFTERGEVVVRVLKEREEPRSLTLLFRISDTGVGLAPEQQRQLFQPYRQLTTKPGSGLGLVITRKLAELMGGNVSVESSTGQGATFSATVVLGRQPEPPQAPAFDALRGCRAWVCEPHTTARLALLHSFEYWGMDVREFGSAAELREAAGRHNNATSPDVIVVGLSRAEAEQEAAGEGRSLLPALKQLGVPVLALSAAASQNLHEALRQKGATRAVPKAVGRLALYDALRELVSGQDVSAARLQGQHVLVADNNVANRRYIVALLQGLGAKTTEASDGREAVERWTEIKPDAVLMDIRMPNLDGLGAAREIRAREGGGKRSLIIGISAFFEPDERRKLALAGMDGDLLKPFDERQLVRLFVRRAAAPTVAPEAPKKEKKVAADKLAQDAEMRALLREELPVQLRELEDAFAAGEMQRLRDAGHQIHGTAAFYRLAPLKRAAAALEARVAGARSIESEPRLKDDLSSVREAVVAMLQEMQDA
jgi:two-component system sensor histidine kinase BarA